MILILLIKQGNKYNTIKKMFGNERFTFIEKGESKWTEKKSWNYSTRKPELEH
jgi:hypothetical protein